jgi:hypothetical protein
LKILRRTLLLKIGCIEKPLWINMDFGSGNLLPLPNSSGVKIDHQANGLRIKERENSTPPSFAAGQAGGKEFVSITYKVPDNRVQMER